jgi:hypothetical protein
MKCFYEKSHPDLVPISSSSYYLIRSTKPSVILFCTKYSNECPHSHENSSQPSEMHWVNCQILFLFYTRLEKYKTYGVAKDFFKLSISTLYLLSTSTPFDYSLIYYVKFVIQPNK